MLRLSLLFLLMVSNHNQEVTLFNNIKAIDYIKESTLYTHKYGHEYNKEWYKEV